MAFVLKDRVKEETTTTGTGAISLGGTSSTFDQFQSYMSNGDTTYYTISHTVAGTDEWEVGVGTWNTGNTLTRTTVLAGSNGTSAVNFSAGTKDVFMTYPASKAVFKDASGNLADVSLSNFDTDDLSEGSTNQYYTDARVNSHLSGGTGVTYSDGAISIGQAVGTSDNVTFNNITSGGTVTLNADPSAALQAATKQYVDTIASAGLHYHDPVRVEHPSNLNATYDNGSSGVGATLTNAGTNAAIQLDGVTLSLNDRVLVANQTTQTQNGVYTVTTVGDGSTAWVLTRSTDTDSSAPSDPNALGKGDAFFIKEGDTNAGHLDVLTTSGTITFGTTNIVFAEVAETTVYQAGDSLTLTGTTFDTVQDIRTTASPTFAGVTAPLTGNVTGNLTGNVTGNVTGDLTGDVTGNADTATALATARDIQLSGDVTGTVSFDGSGNVNMTTAVVDDSHAHIISNVDGLQTALDGKVATSFTVTSGNGLTGGGDLTANRTLAVGAGTGVTVNADDVAIGQDVATTATVEFAGIGIGTSSPDKPLHILSTTPDHIVLEANSTTIGPNIIFKNTDGNLARIASAETNTLRFEVGPSNTEAMRIDNSGQVGIGTSSPSAPLHLYGASNQLITVESTDANANIAFKDNSTTNVAQVGVKTNDMFFATGGTERMRIDSLGNVGIGVTPKTGGSTWQHVQFGGTGNIIARHTDSTVDAIFASNYYINSSGTDSYIATGDAARLFFNDDVITFENAGSGSADAAISWNERMRITSSGSVGIGTSSPSNKLDIKGTVGFEATNSTNSWLAYTYTDNTFRLNYNGAGADEIVIDSSGQVGIGTDSPDSAYKMTIESTASEAGLRVQGDSARIAVWENGSATIGAGPNFYMQNVSGGTYAATMQMGPSSEIIFFQYPNSGSWNERLRIGSAGQIGLGGANYGTSGQVLTSNGSGSAPTWQNAGAGSDAATLDGLDSTQFLRSDADDTVSAGVTYSWSATDTEGLRFTNTSYNKSLYIGGWTTANTAGISRIRNSNDNLHMDSGANGNMYLNWYSGGSVNLGSALNLNTNTISGVTTLTTTELHVTDSNTQIEEGTNNSIRLRTNSGYGDFGPQNSSWFHMNTDRANFYMGTGLRVNGTLGVYNQNTYLTSNDLYLDGSIFHYGDTNTYVEFHAADQWRVVTGGTERFEVNNDRSTFQTHLRIDGGHNLEVGDGGGNERILIQKADNNASDHIIFYNGTSRVGEIGCEDTTWLRINQETNKNIYTPRMIRADAGFQTGSYITHVGDTNTYIGFAGNDQFQVTVGNSTKLHVNTTGVRIGDTGNGYIQPVSGNYGSIQIDGGAHGNWEGYNIGGRMVFMHNNSTASGIYNDVNNEWLVYCVNNSSVYLRHNNSDRVQTTSYGAFVNGNVRSQSTAKVWTNFESIGTLSVRDSLNQSSVTDLGAGYFRSNFSSNTANSSYSVGGSSGGTLPNYGSRVLLPQAYATSSFTFYTEWQPAQGKYDSDHINIMIIGD